MNDELQMAGVLIFLKDFNHTRRFASEILRAKLHTRNRTPLRELTHLAFNTSLVVSYGRPFFRNYNFGGGVSSLTSRVTTVLKTSEDRALHDKMLSLRLKAYSHSDGDSHLLDAIDYNGTGVKFTKDAFVLLDESETHRLRTMARHWIAYLEGERLKLAASAREGTPNKSLDASGGGVFRIMTGPAMLD